MLAPATHARANESKFMYNCARQPYKRTVCPCTCEQVCEHLHSRAPRPHRPAPCMRPPHGMDWWHAKIHALRSKYYRYTYSAPFGSAAVVFDARAFQRRRQLPHEPASSTASNACLRSMPFSAMRNTRAIASDATVPRGIGTCRQGQKWVSQRDLCRAGNAVGEARGGVFSGGHRRSGWAACP